MKFVILALICVSLQALAAETVTSRTTKKTTGKDGSVSTEETVVTKTKTAPGEKAPDLTQADGESKEDFKTRMKAQLDSLSAQIRTLKNDAVTASADAKVSIEKKADALDVKRTEIAKELDRASNKTGRAWTQFKSGMQKAVNELQSGYSEAKNEFSKDAQSEVKKEPKKK